MLPKSINKWQLKLKNSSQMKDLSTCSLDELLTERQNAIEAGNIVRYRACNELIFTRVNFTVKKLGIEEMFEDLKNECELNSFESTLSD
jgi:hypothetical protein